jgi:CBS domain-containing membrane protein
MSAGRRVRDVMSRELHTLHRNDKLSLADDVMRMERVRHLPVLDEESGALVGVLSQRDLFRGALARALGYGETAQRRLLDLLVVKEVMTNDPISVSPDTTLREAARTLVQHKIGCLPVVEGDQLVGILTEGDFAALATNEPDPRR